MNAPSFKYAKQPNPEHHVPDVIERFNKYGFRGSKQVVQMIWSGAFERFPKLNVYVAEVQIGWVPNWMDQMDNEYGRQQYWAERVLGLPRLKRMPSEIAREHVYWGFNRNPVGGRIARQEMGVDNIRARIFLSTNRLAQFTARDGGKLRWRRRTRSGNDRRQCRQVFSSGHDLAQRSQRAQGSIMI